MSEEKKPESQPASPPQKASVSTPPANAVYAQPVIVQKRGRFSRMFSWLGWMGLLLCIPMLMSMAVAYQDYFDTTGGISEKFHSLEQMGTDKIAIISATGTIAMGEGGYIKKQIDRVRKDDKVKGIVLRVNSPGGSVTASDYALHHLNKLREEKDIPLVVSMGSVAASGGYYVAMAVGDQEDSIFAEPTTTTGSIGVIVPHYNVSELMTRYDVVDDSVVSHPRKQLLAMTKPQNKEHRAIIQDYVDQAFNRFKDIVKSGRPAFREDEGALDELATGEIFTAQSAVENGLVDQIGFIEDAIDRVVELANLDKDKVRVVKYNQKGTLMNALGFSQADLEPAAASSSALLTPQAYYLWSALPGFTESDVIQALRAR